MLYVSLDVVSPAGDSVPVLYQPIPTTRGNFGSFMRVPRAADTHSVMSFEFTVKKQIFFEFVSMNDTSMIYQCLFYLFLLIMVKPPVVH